MVATGLYVSTAVHVQHTSVVAGVIDLAYLTPEDELAIEQQMEKKYNVEFVRSSDDIVGLDQPPELIRNNTLNGTSA